MYGIKFCMTKKYKFLLLTKLALAIPTFCSQEHAPLVALEYYAIKELMQYKINDNGTLTKHCCMPAITRYNATITTNSQNETILSFDVLINNGKQTEKRNIN